MIKYTEYALTFAETPDEAALVINISNCPHRCPGCHSPYLQEDTGNELSVPLLLDLIGQHRDEITCVCFMGEGQDVNALRMLLEWTRSTELKTALYSGSDSVDMFLLPYLDYLKLGPYKAEFGGLDKKTTNQRYYKVNHTGDGPVLEDITYKFWRHYE